MPFEKVDIPTIIKERLDNDLELKNIWDSSRMEYEALGDLIKIRKNKGLSQSELAQMSGNKQQIISRIENKENSPTLKTICSILDALDYKIQFVPKQQNTIT